MNTSLEAYWRFKHRIFPVILSNIWRLYLFIFDWKVKPQLSIPSFPKHSNENQCEVYSAGLFYSQQVVTPPQPSLPYRETELSRAPCYHTSCFLDPTIPTLRESVERHHLLTQKADAHRLSTKNPNNSTKRPSSWFYIPSTPYKSLIGNSEVPDPGANWDDHDRSRSTSRMDQNHAKTPCKMHTTFGAQRLLMLADDKTCVFLASARLWIGGSETPQAHGVKAPAKIIL
ncbi:uncharacterized protein FOMMEDRAFT_168954 [Fomitiporia mediterranea MF3/22]|uniref:uncharacterized protein n=1 Tax=Fomitiporia mediterranea (strain MF3/22) TaxID=694068 RepID=UPI0004409581|nr:uncharacterized protein FOMMEDRAFT_168954 [Fomitiporia mediterranea MF3/22]EJD02516.1 hypothetical protein FOMMEDRAFT_168954 [Fomitiporia mediterranea MF3/22]